MPRIYLLISSRDIEKRFLRTIKDLMPQLEAHVLDPALFSEDMDLNSDINVFVVEIGSPDMDYPGMGHHLKSFAKDSGVSVLALDPDQGGLHTGLKEINPDGFVEFPCSDSQIISQVEYLIKISELRSMNLNLGEQINRRIARLKALEKQLRHTNWILESLNKCSEVIIKAQTENEMLDGVCDILATSLGSCLVLVGYAETDPSSTVKIVAARGDMLGMSRQLKLSWDSGPQGMEPTGTAIRTGKRVLVDNPAGEPSLTPWKELIREHDLRYILSCPIAYAGVGFGALSIYSGRDNAFSEDDLDNLERMIRMMGYGIWFLRHRHKRKQVEDELKKTNELFNLAMEATEDALWEWNIAGGRTYFSPRWYTMLDYEPGELPMEYPSFRKIVHPVDLERVEKELSIFMDQGSTFSIEFMARTKKGETRWILTRGKVIGRDSSGRPLRVVGTHVDLTSRKKLEEELTRARQRAETANKVKDRFLEAMSHELRTPLNGIMSILQILAEADLEAWHKEYVEMALDSSRQLLVSINKILELSSLQKGMRKVYREKFSLRKEMTRIRDFFRPTALNKNLELGLEISADIPDSFIGDISIIRQIIWNFMDNAIKFTRKGHVLLRVSVSEDRVPGSTAETWRLVFNVIDTGPGIPEVIKEKLFEPFAVVDELRFKGLSGHGLGLSVCKQLGETMGAGIGVSSQPGQGSSFFLTVDLEPQVRDDPETVDSPGFSGSRRILVVEDDKISLMLLERMLKSSGFEVLSAADGEAALELLENNPDIDLVLTDIMIPGHDGYELTSMIRQGKFSGLKDVPVVAITALADPETRQKCFEHGMNEYLSKPVENQDFMAIVRKYAGNPRPG